MSQPWEVPSLQDQQGLRCQNIKKTQLTQNTIYKKWDDWAKAKPIQAIVSTFYINSPFALTLGQVEKEET